MEMNTVSHECQPDKSSDQFKRASTQEPVRVENDASFSAWSLLGKRWTLLIIAQLLTSPQSFQELSKNTQGISESVLTERLKELEREGVVQRQAHNGRSSTRVTYHLTAKGEALEPVIRAIQVWSQYL
jgi:DNA-binding HxlR family transcriptional regulator